jgi:hypothetical protein
MPRTFQKPGPDEHAAWWEGKSPGQIVFGLFFPLYALKNDKRSVTSKRIIIGLGIGIALLVISYFSKR